jgi:hypothetical protein
MNPNSVAFVKYQSKVYSRIADSSIGSLTPNRVLLIYVIFSLARFPLRS